MKPLPAHKTITGKPAGEIIPSLPTVLAPSTGSYSSANRRISPSCPAQRAYPWLLFTSTAVAAMFCLLYITKPVILPAPAMIAPGTAGKTPSMIGSAAAPATAPASLMPSRSSLPGEAGSDDKPIPSDPRQALGQAASASIFEETNLRIQHVLTAEAPGGHLDRIVLDVPVLYQSRHLRWTPDEVAEARQLLLQLMDYQEKCQTLRTEGVELLDKWNQLIETSIPSTELRADSPTLPANQEDAHDTPRPAGLITTDSIQIQPAGQ